jgi:hypothetical protein
MIKNKTFYHEDSSASTIIDVAVMEKQQENKLFPLHLADLKKSGLSDETINQSRINSIDVDELLCVLSGKAPLGIESAYAIAFPPFDDGFERYRIFYKPNCEKDIDGKKKPKYLQVAKAPNRLYIPPKAFSVLDDASIPLWLTEGEKKALWGCQEGLPTVGITGLWNWCKKGTKNLIDDFDLIRFQGRTVFIVPDSDWKSPNKHGYSKNLEQAVYGLCRALQVRGAKTVIKDLSKVGGRHDNNL